MKKILFVILFVFLLSACGQANEAPVISGVDLNPEVNAGSTFDPLAGVTADDAEDGILTEDIVVAGNTEANLGKVGTFEVTLTVADSRGLETTLIITVTVVDGTKPTFDLITDQEIFAGGSNKNWATLITNETDNICGDLIKQEVSDNVDYNVPGVYVVIVSLTDLAGNTSEQSFNVTVLAIPIHSFIIEVIDLKGTLLYTDVIKFQEGSEKNIVELIADDAETTLNYSTSQWGVFVNGINEFLPTESGITFNYWFSLKVNGEMSPVGIDQIDVVEGMRISLVENTSLDEVDLAVDKVINEFIKNHASTFLNDTRVDHYVLAAMAQLIDSGHNVPALDTFITNATTKDLGRTTIGEAFKTSVFERAFDLNTAVTRSSLEGFSASSVWDAVSLLKGLTNTQGNETQIQGLVAMLTALDSENGNGPDYFGMAMMALAPYRDQANVITMVTELQREVISTLSVDGAVSWGSANAGSTAMVIIGLVGQGIDPRGEDFTVEDYDLIEMLLKYEIEGAFKWQLTDTKIDMGFSTPQGFAALVAYKLYRDTWETPPFDLFDFNRA